MEAALRSGYVLLCTLPDLGRHLGLSRKIFLFFYKGDVLEATWGTCTRGLSPLWSEVWGITRVLFTLWGGLWVEAISG